MAADYGPILYSPDYLDRLRGLVLTQDELHRAAYVLGQLSPHDLEWKRRCVRCCRAMKSNKCRARKRQAAGAPASAAPQDPDKPDKPDEIIVRCKFHPGVISRKRWTCCRNHISAKPCAQDEWHSPRLYAVGELETNWIFYATPSTSPPFQPAAVVVIDCEMGTACSGESELIRVSVVDYFSRNVLLDRLVLPDAKMSHYNTRYSGISKPMMDDALRRGRCFLGRDEARIAVLRLIGPKTIVVGHAGNQDLTSLRWIHSFVIDTLHIEKKRRKDKSEAEDAAVAAQRPAPPLQTNPDDEKDAAPRHETGLSLKALARERLNREIQTKGKGHDSVEDALATRDLLHWYVTHPD
ncbi:hypothetical protein XA68_10065 [Ophiocordyceps unilateralis]|uniref:Exonuclease domain-containing protein n=1 Tax=Ophiocordyceps unilateralis TaxID=268505 RepID=A0A2A9PRC4_OPHUN|nr:hypothetical protein XA68_10065 [Ophiocordyceps unilateralis]